MRIALSCVVMVLFVWASPAEAQSCLGSPSFRDQPLQVGLGASFTEGARGVGGTFAGGGESIFGGAGLSVLKFTDIDETSTSVSLFGGADLQADDRGIVFLCPIGQLDFSSGPDFGPVDVSLFGFQAGGSLGVIAYDAQGLMVIPHFGLAAVYTRVTTDVGDIETSANDTSGLATIGVGFVFNRNVGIVPTLGIPFSAGSSDVIFTLKFLFNFGG